MLGAFCVDSNEEAGEVVDEEVALVGDGPVGRKLAQLGGPALKAIYVYLLDLEAGELAVELMPMLVFGGGRVEAGGLLAHHWRGEEESTEERLALLFFFRLFEEAQTDPLREYAASWLAVKLEGAVVGQFGVLNLHVGRGGLCGGVEKQGRVVVHAATLVSGREKVGTLFSEYRELRFFRAK